MRSLSGVVATVLAVTASLAGAPATRAQEAGALLRGTVADSAGTPIPFALVRTLPGAAEQFTSPRGAFAVAGLAPGTYRVQVRQVGYLPFDSAVAIGPDGATLRVVLRALAIQLDALTVAATGPCTDPGPPDPRTSPELAAIFAELRENARRYVVLADGYPFLYFIERTFDDYDDRGRLVSSATDTVQFRSDSRGRYRPGDVIEEHATGRGWRERAVRLPTLPDLADSAFHANHCFAFGGVREQNGERLIRISFRTAERLRPPDIDGEADLDADTYRLRSLTFQLTRPDRALPDLRSLSGTMALLTLHPNLVVPGSIRSAQVMERAYAPWPRRPLTRFLEYQRLVRVHFLRPLPTDSVRAP
jgi:hypothetical protein